MTRDKRPRGNDRYPCDDPTTACCCACFCLRALVRDMCCAVGASTAAAERLKRSQRSSTESTTHHGCISCFRIPVGRTAHFFDIDIVADVQERQQSVTISPVSSRQQQSTVRPSARLPDAPPSASRSSQAHQSCFQLCLNEGSLRFGRMQGGDASHNAGTQAFFNIKHVPEVRQ
jgi:hypothetical protein